MSPRPPRQTPATNRPELILDLLETEVALNGHTMGPGEGGMHPTTVREALRAGRDAIATVNALKDPPTGLDAFNRLISGALADLNTAEVTASVSEAQEYLATGHTRAVLALALATAAVARRQP